MEVQNLHNIGSCERGWRQPDNGPELGIKLGLVPASQSQVRAVATTRTRLWTSRDVSRLRTLKGTQKTGPKPKLSRQK